jgi:hypothetical protein
MLVISLIPDELHVGDSVLSSTFRIRESLRVLFAVQDVLRASVVCLQAANHHGSQWCFEKPFVLGKSNVMTVMTAI